MACYHGGTSLQGCIVPVITIHLDRPDQEPVSQTSVTLNYKDGAKRITTGLPVIEIRIDNGWTVKIDRGLGFYQKPDSLYGIGSNELSLRKCLQTKIDVYRH